MRSSHVVKTHCSDANLYCTVHPCVIHLGRLCASCGCFPLTYSPSIVRAFMCVCVYPLLSSSTSLCVVQSINQSLCGFDRWVSSSAWVPSVCHRASPGARWPFGSTFQLPITDSAHQKLPLPPPPFLPPELKLAVSLPLAALS